MATKLPGSAEAMLLAAVFTCEVTSDNYLTSLCLSVLISKRGKRRAGEVAQGSRHWSCIWLLKAPWWVPKYCQEWPLSRVGSPKKLWVWPNTPFHPPPPAKMVEVAAKCYLVQKVIKNTKWENKFKLLAQKLAYSQCLISCNWYYYNISFFTFPLSRAPLLWLCQCFLAARGIGSNKSLGTKVKCSDYL